MASGTSAAPKEGVERDVHEHRAGAPAERRAHALRRHTVGLIRRRERHRLLRQALHDLDVVHLLQRAHAPPGVGRAAPDDEHRAVGRLRLGERRGGVGHAGPGSDGRDADLSCHLGPPLGRERGGLLVAHVDDPDAVLGRAGEDRPDMAAVQREEVTDSRVLEGERDELPCVG